MVYSNGVGIHADVFGSGFTGRIENNLVYANSGNGILANGQRQTDCFSRAVETCRWPVPPEAELAGAATMAAAPTSAWRLLMSPIMRAGYHT
jgi:hypothetical protein